LVSSPVPEDVRTLAGEVQLLDGVPLGTSSVVGGGAPVQEGRGGRRKNQRRNVRTLENAERALSASPPPALRRHLEKRRRYFLACLLESEIKRNLAALVAADRAD